MDRITTKRHRRVRQSLHTASRRMIDLLVEEGSGVLGLGKNPFWNTHVALGKKHKQECVHMPQATFFARLTDTAEAKGIGVLVTEERDTSPREFPGCGPFADL